MKTKLLVGAAVMVAMNAAAVNAQVLGGNAAGGLGGTLHGRMGGLNDVNVVGQGGAHGTFGSSIDSDGMRRTTSDISGRARNRSRDTIGVARGQARSSVGVAESTGKRTISTARERSASVTEGVRNVDAAGNARAGAEWSAGTALSATKGAPMRAGDEASTMPSKHDASQLRLPSNSDARIDGAARADANAHTTERLPSTIAVGAGATAASGASVSKDGASAAGEVNAN